MLDIMTILVLMFAGAALLLLGVWMGAFLMYKGKSSQPNESFIGKPAKGEVFSIPDIDGIDEFPGTGEPGEAEQHVLKKTENFLKAFAGGR